MNLIQFAVFALEIFAKTTGLIHISDATSDSALEKEYEIRKIVGFTDLYKYFYNEERCFM